MKKEPQFLNIPDISVHKILGKSLIFRRPKQRRAVRLKGYLVFYSKVLGREVIVPEGFISDGASVPQLFWNLFPPFGMYLESAIVHDYLCVRGHKKEAYCNSIQTHLVFLEAMRAQDIGRIQRGIMFCAVFCFGPKFRRHVV